MSDNGQLGTEQDDAARESRRKVLKAGVAAGVGVAVWSTPNIRSIGGTPAYAQVCTVPNTGFFLGCTNTRANCPNGVGFKPIFGNAGTSFGNGGSIVENFTGNGNANDPSSGCPGAPSTVTITVPNDQAGCRLTVIVHQKNCDNNWTWNPSLDKIDQLPFCPANPNPNLSCELARDSTAFVVGAGNSGIVNMPTIPCGGGGIPCGVFWSAVVECNTSPNCV